MKKPPQKQSLHQRLKNGGLFLIVAISLILAAIGIIIIIGILRVTGNGGYVGPHKLTTEEKAQIQVALMTDDYSYPCINNPKDYCTNSMVLGYYPVGFRSSELLQSYTPTDSQTIKQIFGQISYFSDTVVKLNTSSGRTFTIHFSSGTLDAVKKQGYTFDFNDPDNIMLVDYREEPDESSTDISVSKVLGTRIGIRFSIPPKEQKQLFGATK